VNLVDSHCHLPLIDTPGGVETLLAAARDQDVHHFLCVCIDLDGFPAVLDLAHRYRCISASVGIHPNTETAEEAGIERLVQLASDPCVVAIGETGLDYFRSHGNLDWQRRRFRTHIRAAREIRKPLIVHCREAGEDVIRILQEEGADRVGGVMHCFVEDLEIARQAMDLDFYISFSGIVTFRNARAVQEVAREVPESAILIETDSPFLAPVPFRGKQNQPAYVRHVAEFLAHLRETSLEGIAASTTANFNRLFLS